MRAPRSVDTILRTFICLLVLPPALALYSAVAIARALRKAPAERVHEIYVGYARLAAWFGGTEIRVHGTDRIAPGQAYVVVVNHESAWDPVCVVAGLPDLLIRFVAKTAIIRIPIFGKALALTGNVRVDRHETSGDVSRIQEGMGRRDPAVSLLFFAEGSRSLDGAFRPFKMGAFATAISHGLPLLPVATAGTFAIWPKGTLRLARAPVALEVGDPIPTEGLSFDDRHELRDRAHAAVAGLRAAARSRLRAAGTDPGGVD